MTSLIHSRKVLVTLRLLAVVGLTGVTALAADTALEGAKKQFALGKQAYDVGHFAEALKAYAEAYRLKPLPAFLFNIAQCHRLLGEHEQAAFVFKRYLAAAPNAENRAQVEDFIREIEDGQAQQRKARQEEAELARQAERARQAATVVETEATARKAAQLEAIRVEEAEKDSRKQAEDSRRRDEAAAEATLALETWPADGGSTGKSPVALGAPIEAPKEEAAVRGGASQIGLGFSLRGEVDVLNRSWSPAVGISWLVVEHFALALHVVALFDPAEIGLKAGATFHFRKSNVVLQPYLSAGPALFLGGRGVAVGLWVALGLQVNLARFLAIGAEVPVEYYPLRPPDQRSGVFVPIAAFVALRL